jgi:hypothetical protein
MLSLLLAKLFKAAVSDGTNLSLRGNAADPSLPALT